MFTISEKFNDNNKTLIEVIVAFIRSILISK